MISLNEESQSIWQAENLERLRYEYDLSKDDLVIDIGAHEGEFSRKIQERYGCRVIAVEPTGYIEGFSGEVINAAASDHDGYELFGGLSLYTSIYEPPAHRYPCFDINKWLLELPEVALMKINIEGGEYKLLNHMIDGKVHKRIKNLQVQFHIIDDEPIEEMYYAIASKLFQTHRLTWRYSFCWENWERN